MNTPPYKVEVKNSTMYTFASNGPKGIFVKEVVITPLIKSGYYNFGFGDACPDGSIDDEVETNNGDLIKVFATIISIIEDFLEGNPGSTLYFTGSTPQRTVVYNIILKRYYLQFSRKYLITGIQRVNNILSETEYNPIEVEEYEGFFVRKK
ncbi:DUF6934 family protein [Chitinophaga barathri]|uniref:DUF6934 family protein n=1 Tax=Chitinophaga barathri TaxID=1647451 RepID=UPI000EA3FDBD